MLLLLLLGLPTAAAEDRVYTPSEVPNVQVQDYRRFVSDPEGYFTSEERAALDRALFDLRDRHTVEVVLVVVPAVPEDDPETFTEELFRLWGVGKSQDDNGLLILYVTGHDRLIRFETGYGLEGALPDAATHGIAQRILIPGIKEGRAADAFLEGFDRIDTYLTEGYDASNDGNVDYTSSDSFRGEMVQWILFYLILSVFVAVLTTFDALRRLWRISTPGARYSAIRDEQRKTLSWSLLFLPGFLLIYYPYIWWQLAKWRRRLTDCPFCDSKGTVTELRYPNNLRYLVTGEALEEKLRSVAHPVLLCSNCHQTQVMSIDRNSAKYTYCPRCKVKAYHQDITTDSRGRKRVVSKCENCGHEERHTNRIRRRGFGGPVIFGGGGFGGGGFGGGFGGGGFGGGFGGGASGGGGSTSRF